MRTFNQIELDAMLYRHYKWLRGMAGGERADLSRADLSRADLSRANLSRANLSRADLSRADLSDANLSDAKEDLFSILDHAAAEVDGLLLALRDGRINGRVYESDCACLVGTIANVRGCHYLSLPGIQPNGGRPAERWFLAIHPGHTPENNPIAKITEDWILEWVAVNVGSTGAELE